MVSQKRIKNAESLKQISFQENIEKIDFKYLSS